MSSKKTCRGVFAYCRKSFLKIGSLGKLISSLKESNMGPDKGAGMKYLWRKCGESRRAEKGGIKANKGPRIKGKEKHILHQSYLELHSFINVFLFSPFSLC